MGQQDPAFARRRSDRSQGEPLVQSLEDRLRFRQAQGILAGLIDCGHVDAARSLRTTAAELNQDVAALAKRFLGCLAESSTEPAKTLLLRIAVLALLPDGGARGRGPSGGRDLTPADELGVGGGQVAPTGALSIAAMAGGMSVRGVLDAATAPLLHASTRPEAVATASRSSDGEAFHLDLAGLTHLDGAGVRALDVLATTIGDRGSTLHVTTPFSAELARLLDFAVSMQWLPANFAGKPSGPTRPHCDRAGARQTEQTPTPTHSARLAELEALYDRHASACWSLARHLLADDDKADAVVQNAFLQLWQQLTSDTRPAGQTGAQLLGRTHGEAVHRLREERTGPWPPTRPPDGEPPGALNQRHDRRPPQSHPRAGLSGLPEQQASALRLAFWTGLTVQEIAATTGTPLADVRANLLAGVRTLTRERNHPPPSANGRGHGADLQ